MGGTYSYLTGAYYIYKDELNKAIKNKKYVVNNKHKYYILENNGNKIIVLDDKTEQKLYFYYQIKCSNILDDFQELIPIVNKWGYVNVGDYNYIFDYIINNENIFDISKQVMPILTTNTPFKTVQYTELFVGSNVFYERLNLDENNDKINIKKNNNIIENDVHSYQYKLKNSSDYANCLLYKSLNNLLENTNICNKYICIIGDKEFEIVLDEHENIKSFFVNNNSNNNLNPIPIIITDNKVYTPSLKKNKWSLLELGISNTFRKNILKGNLYTIDNINRFKQKERLNSLLLKLI